MYSIFFINCLHDVVVMLENESIINESVCVCNLLKEDKEGLASALW